MSNREENLRKGYIRLHRSMLNWEWYDDANTMRLFVHLLLSANHETKEWHGIKIEAGQLIIGRLKLAEQLKLSERKIRTALKNLKTTKEVTIETTKSYSLITLNNWHLYNQENDQEDDQQVTINNTTTTTNTTSSSVTKNKKIQTEKKFIKPKLEDVQKFIREKKLTIDGEKFFNYYDTIGWKVGKNQMKSWKSALFYWQRTEKNYDQDNSEYLFAVEKAFNKYNGGNK